MKTLKMSLENIQGKMSRKEMRNIMAGSTGSCSIEWTCYHGGKVSCSDTSSPFECLYVKVGLQVVGVSCNGFTTLC